MRHKESLKKKYFSIGYNIGFIIIFLSFLLLLPLLILPFYPDEIRYTHLFVLPFIISLVTGIVLTFLCRKSEKMPLSTVDAGIVIVFTWAYACVIGAFPLYLLGGYNILHGLFESVSGWTTTGLSVVDVTQVPRLILMWRSITQFIGGAGFAVIMIVVLTRSFASGVFKAEGRSGEIEPEIKKTALVVLKIYFVILLIGTIAYIVAGMEVFDAINHCMAVASTGGFSTKPNSINSFNSFPIEVVSVLLMLIAQTGFHTLNFVFHKDWRSFFKNAEVRSSIAILLIVMPLIFFFVTVPMYAGDYDGISEIWNFSAWWSKFGIAVRRAIFEPTSALTSTGFNSAPTYENWLGFGVLLMIVLMWIGGHTNSTAGGIKQFRVYILTKSFSWSIKSQLLPKSAVVANKINIGDKPTFINNQHLLDVLNFVIIYILTFLVGSIIITLHGVPIRDAFFETASAISTIGLSIGITGYDAPPGILLTEIVCMFFGRLEFMVIIVSFIKFLNDIKSLYHK